MNSFGVVLFHTTSSAMRAEKLAKVAGVAVKLIPTPREFSSDCGVALRFAREQSERVRALLAEAGVEIEGIRAMDEG